MRSGSRLVWGGVLLLTVMAVYTGVLFFQRARVGDETMRVVQEAEALNKKVLQYENTHVTAAITAKQAVGTLEEREILWSQVIKKIQATIPRKKGVSLVSVQSYSGSSGRTLSMSVKTRPDSESPYFDVAAVIKSFNDSLDFVDAFVPSISAGEDENGDTVLSFTMSLKFLAEQEIQKRELEEAITDVLQEATVPVTR